MTKPLITLHRFFTNKQHDPGDERNVRQKTSITSSSSSSSHGDEESDLSDCEISQQLLQVQKLNVVSQK